MEAVLDSADGSSTFVVQDSSTTEVMHIDSDGNIVTKGCIRIDSGGAECTTAENLIVDGNVGIGISTPTGALQVVGDEMRIGVGGTVNTATGAGDLYIQNDLEVDGILYGDGSGLTGLSGVTASAIAYDDINNPDDISGINFGENTNVWTSTATTQDFFTINATSLTTGTAMVVTNTGGASSLSFKVEDETSDTTPFVITDDGKVGIGTSSPAATLEIATGQLIVQNGTPASPGIEFSDGSGFEATNPGIALIGLGKRRFVADGGSRPTWGFVADEISWFGFGSGGSASDPDTFIYKDATRTVAFRDGTGSNEIRIYNTDNGADDEFLSIGAINNSNVFTFESEATGSGTIRPMVFMGGNVGIGTASPSGKLDIEGGDVFIGTGTLTNASGSEDLSVTGNLEVDGILYGDGSGLTGLSGVTASAIAYDDINNPDDISGINFGENTNVWTSTATTQDFFTINATSLTTGTAMVVTNTGGASSLSFKVEDETSDATPFVITDDGDVGIGMTSPGAKLEISTSTGGATNGIKLSNTSIVSLRYRIWPGTATPDAGMITFGDASGWKFHFGRDTDNGATKFMTIVSSTGNVGIGTTNPSGKLDIEGGDVFIGTGTLTNASGSEDLSITGNLEVDGILYGDGSGLTGLSGVTASAIAYDDINNPDDISGINFGENTNVWTSTATTQDFFTINATSLTTGTAMVVTNTGGASSLSFKVEDETSDTTPFVITDDGNVGVGTTEPSAKFMVISTSDGAPSNGRDIFSVRGSALQLMFGINSVDQYGWIEAQQEGISSARDIVLNALGGKVGIGTTGPNRKLHVLSSGVIMDAESSSTSSYIDVIGTNNQLRIGTFGGVVGIGEGTSTIPDLAINSSGNVGIGTTSPGALLDVAGAEATDAEIILDADQGDDAADTWKIQSAASDNDLNIINDTSTLVTVQSDGKVGIGTTSPSAAMQIKGADDTWNSHIRLEDDTTTDYSVIIQDNQGMKFRTFTNNDNFYFRDNSNITIMMLEDGGNVGIGTTAPVSTLDINGSVSFSTVSKTADYTATDSDHVILVNSSSGNVTITLPAVSGVSGRVYIFKKTSADGNNVIIDGNASETIDGAVTKTFSTQYEVVTIISDGTVWWVL